MINLLIADGSELALEGLEALLRGTEFKVVARCRHDAEVLDSLDAAKPHVLLLDFDLPRAGGLDLLRTLRKRSDPARVILMTTNIRGADALEAFRLGVNGLVREEPNEILHCLAQVGAGGHWIDPLALHEALNYAANEGEAEITFGLTAREMDTIRLVGRGLRNREIASQLSISEGTVKMHLHNVYVKLGIKSRTRLALLAQHHDRSLVGCVLASGFDIYASIGIVLWYLHQAA